MLMIKPVNLECGHEFDKHAIQNSLITKKMCPLCQKPAKHEDMRPSLGL